MLGALGAGGEQLADPRARHADSPGLLWVPHCSARAQYLIWHSQELCFQGASAGIPFLAEVPGGAGKAPHGAAPDLVSPPEKSRPQPGLPETSPHFFELSPVSGSCSTRAPPSSGRLVQRTQMPCSYNAKALFLEVMSVWVYAVLSFRLTERDAFPWKLPVGVGRPSSFPQGPPG